MIATWLLTVRVIGVPPAIGLACVPVPVTVHVFVVESYEPEYATVPPSSVSVPEVIAVGEVGSAAFQRIARA